MDSVRTAEMAERLVAMLRLALTDSHEVSELRLSLIALHRCDTSTACSSPP